MIELHDYQREAVAACLAELDRKGAALCVMPTGTGKSFCGVAAAREVADRGGRTLILLHRDTLFDQWARSCDAFGLSWAVEKAGERARTETMAGRVDVVLGSKDSLRGKRLDRWSPGTFALIISDEAHHSSAKSWLSVFAHFHGAKRLGLTATPERSDDESIQPVFGNVAYELPFWEAVDRQYIKAPYFVRPPCPVDLSALHTSGDDLNQGDLEDAISRHVEVLVNLARGPIDGRQAMCFTPRVYSAAAMADGFRQVGVTACSASGQSPDRDVVIKRFRASQFQLLSSCDLLREGADFPEVSAGVIARPTKSGLVYRQMLGRMLRKHPKVPAAIVVDYAWVSGRHDLFRPIDLFDATGMDLDVLKLAAKLVDQGKEDPREAMREAQEIHRLDLAMRVTVRERDPRYKLIAYDPFQIGALLGVANRQREGQKPCSAANRARLGYYKLQYEGVSDAQARRVLKELDRRRSEHRPTHRQVAALVSTGVPPDMARAMSWDEARGDLDILIGGRA